jgi:hypothetical protein
MPLPSLTRTRTAVTVKSKSFHDILGRFWALVPSRSPDECWQWQGSCDQHGYGQFNILQPDGYWRPLRAHRFMYQIFHHADPGVLCIDHLCRNRRCVNPWHLEAVTKRVNTERGASKKTHCKHGHEMSGYNVMAVVTRVCRECHNRRMRVHFHRKHHAA